MKFQARILAAMLLGVLLIALIGVSYWYFSRYRVKCYSGDEENSDLSFYVIFPFAKEDWSKRVAKKEQAFAYLKLEDPIIQKMFASRDRNSKVQILEAELILSSGETEIFLQLLDSDVQKKVKNQQLQVVSASLIIGENPDSQIFLRAWHTERKDVPLTMPIQGLRCSAIP